MIKTINHDPISLSKKADLATKQDAPVVTDLLETLRANSEICVGMAANMIGINKRIIVVAMGQFPVALINPEISAKSAPYKAKEGCLSLAGEREATRFNRITVTYLDQSFSKHTQTFTGTIAQIIQHEVDHCEGILI